MHILHISIANNRQIYELKTAYNETMSYDVGTHINLQNKQERTQIVLSPEASDSSTLYEPGTKIVFIKMIQDLFTPTVNRQQVAH